MATAVQSERNDLASVLAASGHGDQRLAPWDGVGVDVTGSPDVPTAIRTAGLDWAVEHRPVWTVTPDGSPVPIAGQQAVVRMSDNHALGVTGMVHTLVQNGEAFQSVDPLLAAGDAQLVRAGDLHGGKATFLVARLTEGFVIAGEPYEGYFIVKNNHDGRGGLLATINNIRLWCTNQIPSIVAGQGARWHVKLRHTKTVHGRYVAAQKMLDLATRQRQEFVRQAETLILQPIGADHFRALAERLYPVEGTKIPPRTLAANTERQEQLLEIWASSENLGNIRHTAWGALNAVAEYADHAFNFRGTKRTSRDENRLLSIVEDNGSAQQLKRRALEALQSDVLVGA